MPKHHRPSLTSSLIPKLLVAGSNPVARSKALSGVDHPLIRIAATVAIVIAKTMSIHPERVGPSCGTAAVTMRVAEAGPPGGTPVPVTCEVVFVIGPMIVACMNMGTLQDAP